MSYFGSGPKSLDHNLMGVVTQNTLVVRWVEQMGRWESLPGLDPYSRLLWHPRPFQGPGCTSALPHTPTVVHTNMGTSYAIPHGIRCDNTDIPYIYHLTNPYHWS